MFESLSRILLFKMYQNYVLQNSFQKKENLCTSIICVFVALIYLLFEQKRGKNEDAVHNF